MFQLKQTKHGRGSYLKKNIKKIQPNKHHPKITGLTHSTTHSISLGKLMKTTKLAFLTLQHNQTWSSQTPICTNARETLVFLFGESKGNKMSKKGCLKGERRAHTPSSLSGEANEESNSTSTIATTSSRKCLLNLPTKANTNTAFSIATTRTKNPTLVSNNKERREIEDGRDE